MALARSRSSGEDRAQQQRMSIRVTPELPGRREAARQHDRPDRPPTRAPQSETVTPLAPCLGLDIGDPDGRVDQSEVGQGLREVSRTRPSAGRSPPSRARRPLARPTSSSISALASSSRPVPRTRWRSQNEQARNAPLPHPRARRRRDSGRRTRPSRRRLARPRRSWRRRARARTRTTARRAGWHRPLSQCRARAQALQLLVPAVFVHTNLQLVGRRAPTLAAIRDQAARPGRTRGRGQPSRAPSTGCSASARPAPPRSCCPCRANASSRSRRCARPLCRCRRRAGRPHARGEPDRLHHRPVDVRAGRGVRTVADPHRP